MKHNVEFEVADQHGFNLPEGTEVQSAKFGRTRAFIWQDPEPASIWRGEPKRIVGHMPVCFWRYVVSGEMSSMRSEEHTSELQSLMRISYAVFCLKKKTQTNRRVNQEQKKIKY